MTTVCDYVGCGRKRDYRSTGWCGLHHRRWLAHGDPSYVRGPLTCTIDGCNEFRRGWGWCSKHYERWKRHGDPLAPVAIRILGTRQERFDAKWSKDANGCWIWTGCLNRAGYGRFSSSESAHRVSYQLHVGPIPAGLHLDHLCEVKRCVNPSHLEAVTPAINFARALVSKYETELMDFLERRESFDARRHEDLFRRTM